MTIGAIIGMSIVTAVMLFGCYLIIDNMIRHDSSSKKRSHTH
jgi:hypothetical protein